MKPQAILTKPEFYIAFSPICDPTRPPVGQETSLRGLVAQLHAQHDLDVRKLTILVAFKDWCCLVGVPRELYLHSREEGPVLQLEALVPEHWQVHCAHTYCAVDFKHGLWVESPTLRGIVQKLHNAGHTFVHSRHMRIGARFARRGNDIDDMAQVPLSLVCIDYDPEDDEAFNPGESLGEDGYIPCGAPLPRKAKLLDPEEVEPHYISGFSEVQYRRLHQLLNDHAQDL